MICNSYHRNNDAIQCRKEELNGFHVPKQMIEKMKMAIRASRKAAECNNKYSLQILASF